MMYAKNRRVSPATRRTPFTPPKPRTASPVSQVGATQSASGSYAVGEKLGAVESVVQRLIQTEGLEQRGLPFSALRRHGGTQGVVLGVDGSYVLRRITESVRARDPMAMLTATMPIALYDELGTINFEIDTVAEALAESVMADGSISSIAFKPVFVFDGIAINASVDPPYTPHPPLPQDFSYYHAQSRESAAINVPPSVKSRAASRFSCEEDVQRAIVRHLKALHRDVFHAPYTAAAQLSSFLLPENRYVSEVYGGLMLLAMPGVERVVTALDVEQRTFSVVYKSALLECINRRLGSGTTGAWTRRFTEADLAEWIMLDSLQEYMQLHLPTKELSDVMNMISRVEAFPVEGFCTAIAELPSREVTKYMSASFATLDCPVLMSSGECLPLYTVHKTQPHSSLTLSEVYGRPLPAVLYFCLFGGLLAPSLVTTAAQRCIVDRWPLIDSVDYREVHRIILPLRIQTCCLLVDFSEALPRPDMWYQQYVQPRHAKNAVEEKWKRTQNKTIDPLTEWDIVHDPLLNSHEIVYFFDVLSYIDRFSQATPAESTPYETVAETCASVLLKTMDLLGYLFHSLRDNTRHIEPSVFGIALSHFSCDTLSEYAVLLIELLRTKALHDDSIRTSVQEMNKTAMYSKGMRFACRLLSIIPLNVNGAWSGPFDVEMAAFSHLSRSVSRMLRGVVEVLATLSFTTHRTRLPLEQLVDVMTALPFHIPMEFCAGNLMLFIMQNPQCTLRDLEQIFPECYTLESDLTTLFGFWLMACPALYTLAEELHLDPQLIENADILVHSAALRLDAQTFAFMA